MSTIVAIRETSRYIYKSSKLQEVRAVTCCRLYCTHHSVSLSCDIMRDRAEILHLLVVFGLASPRAIRRCVIKSHTSYVDLDCKVSRR